MSELLLHIICLSRVFEKVVAALVEGDCPPLFWHLVAVKLHTTDTMVTLVLAVLVLGLATGGGQAAARQGGIWGASATLERRLGT